MMSVYSKIYPKTWESKVTCQTDPAFGLCIFTDQLERQNCNCVIGVQIQVGGKN
jgi:hypothetical protein